MLRISHNIIILSVCALMGNAHSADSTVIPPENIVGTSSGSVSGDSRSKVGLAKVGTLTAKACQPYFLYGNHNWAQYITGYLILNYIVAGSVDSKTYTERFSGCSRVLTISDYISVKLSVKTNNGNSTILNMGTTAYNTWAAGTSKSTGEISYTPSNVVCGGISEHKSMKNGITRSYVGRSGSC